MLYPGPEHDDHLLAQALTVSQITSQVKGILEESLPMCWVAGEVVEFSRASSGHCYFSLKDADSQLSCVAFRFYAQQFDFVPEPGMMVMAYGSISVYERGGRYQFLVNHLRPAGVGELALAFENMRRRLEEEGLFDESRKRPLPAYPLQIGIVTSPTGAALRDMINVISRRAPSTQLVLAPARVQGPGAAEEIARAIDILNRFGGCDILIVGRGGGSSEDLWAFNEEVVARAIFASSVPVVSAVGHEVDNTIADYVADVRAPTPSAAAEIAAPDRRALSRQLGNDTRRLRFAMTNRLQHHRDHLGDLDVSRLAGALRQRCDQSGQVVDEAGQALLGGLQGVIRGRTDALRTAALRLQGLSPLNGLARGFAFCERDDDAMPVRSAAQLERGDRLRLRFSDGAVLCRVEEEVEHE